MGLQGERRPGQPGHAVLEPADLWSAPEEKLPGRRRSLMTRTSLSKRSSFEKHRPQRHHDVERHRVIRQAGSA